jgi:uncharacterized protein involved in exopolysaccharide biosynthesis
MTPRYVSQIKILIDPRGLQILPNDLSPGAVSADATFAVVESQVQVITSTEVLEKVVARLNLTSDPEFIGNDSADSVFWGGCADTCRSSDPTQAHRRSAA